MTRDMELVRKILLAIAANERPLDSLMVRIANYTSEQIGEHIRMLQEARLLDGNASMGPDRRPRWSELRLTWWGHDFIECARNDAIWRTAQEALGPGNGVASFDVWRKTLIESAYVVLGRAPDGTRRDPLEEQPPSPPGA
jgi:hypothetical protein